MMSISATNRGFLPKTRVRRSVWQSNGNILANQRAVQRTERTEIKVTLLYISLNSSLYNAVELDKIGRSISIDDEFKKEVAILKELTWTYVIEGPALAMQREGQKRIIRLLFEAYAEASENQKRWSLFPPYYRDQLEKETSLIKRKRIVVDLIAGMTEPQAIASYTQLMGVRPAVTFEEILR